MSKWIHFDEPTPSASGKTMVWQVRTAAIPEGGALLGEIAWFGRWRKYAFFPLDGRVFEETCLRDIGDFCQARTRDRKAASA